MKKQIVLVLILSTLVFTGCEEDAIIPSWKNDGGAKPITITSFYPESGESGIVVAIFGENFGASISDNDVTFNGISSEVLQVQPRKIMVRVPLILVQGDYQIALSALNQTVSSAKTYHVKGIGKSL